MIRAKPSPVFDLGPGLSRTQMELRILPGFFRERTTRRMT